MQSRFLSVVAALMITAPVLIAQAKPARPDSLALARQFTTWFYTGQIDSLLAHSPADRRDSTARHDFMEQLDQLSVRAGTETQVIEERFAMRNGRPQYWRTARFTNYPEPILRAG